MRRRNIQHGRTRRMPWSVRIPIALLAVLIPLLVLELVVLFEAAG